MKIFTNFLNIRTYASQAPKYIMIEYAQWMAIIAAFINIILAFIDKSIYKIFRNKEATTPKTTIPIETLNTLQRWRLKRMRFSGFVQDEKTNKYYYDENLHKVKRKNRRIFVSIVMVLAIGIIISIYWVNK